MARVEGRGGPHFKIGQDAPSELGERMLRGKNKVAYSRINRFIKPGVPVSYQEDRQPPRNIAERAMQRRPPTVSARILSHGGMDNRQQCLQKRRLHAGTQQSGRVMCNGDLLSSKMDAVGTWAPQEPQFHPKVASIGAAAA